MAETTPAIKQPVNDENPVFLPLFVYRLRQWMYATHPASRRFVEYGIKTERGKTLTWNVTHALRHKSIKPDQAAPFSWESPFIPYPDEFLPEELIRLYLKEERKASKSEEGDDEMEFPDAESAAALLASISSSATPDYSKVTLSDRDEKRFNTDAADSLSEYDEMLFVPRRVAGGRR